MFLAKAILFIVVVNFLAAPLVVGAYAFKNLSGEYKRDLMKRAWYFGLSGCFVWMFVASNLALKYGPWFFIIPVLLSLALGAGFFGIQGKNISKARIAFELFIFYAVTFLFLQVTAMENGISWH